MNKFALCLYVPQSAFFLSCPTLSHGLRVLQLGRAVVVCKSAYSGCSCDDLMHNYRNGVLAKSKRRRGLAKQKAVKTFDTPEIGRVHNLFVNFLYRLVRIWATFGHNKIDF